MSDVHAQDLHGLLPLGVGLVGLEDVPSQEAVAALDETGDAQGVDAEAQGMP